MDAAAKIPGCGVELGIVRSAGAPPVSDRVWQQHRGFFGIHLSGWRDFVDSGIQEHARSIERSYKMLRLMETAVNLLRSKHKFGETYYSPIFPPSSTKTPRRASSSFSRISGTSATAPIFASGRKPSKLFRQSFGVILPVTA